MDRPVGAAAFAELVGAVERIDDPDPIGGEAATVVGALLGQHDIGGPGGGDRVEQEPVSGGVAGIHHLPRVRTLFPQLLAELHQQRARLDGESRRQTVIVLPGQVIGAGPRPASVVPDERTHRLFIGAGLHDEGDAVLEALGVGLLEHIEPLAIRGRRDREQHDAGHGGGRFRT